MYVVLSLENSDGPAEIKPLPPTGLNAVQVSFTQINLSWTDNSTNETGFEIERKLANGTYQITGTTNTDITNFSTKWRKIGLKI